MDINPGVPTTDQRPVPAVVDAVLTIEELGICVIKFNRLGTLIAAGAVNGFIAIIDVTSKLTTNIWNAHSLSVTHLSWSRDGRFLYSVGVDRTLIVSDISKGQVAKRMLMGTDMNLFILHPRMDRRALIMYKQNLRIQRLDTGEVTNVKTTEKVSTAVFEHRGRRLLVGTTKGKLQSYNIKGNICSSAIIEENQQIRSLYSTRRNDLVIIVAGDRFIRVYDLNELFDIHDDELASPLNILCDPTEKMDWHSACASGDTDHVAGLSANSHQITIFERATGSIVATLIQSQKEIPLGLEWHPGKPVVASVCNGKIFVWKQKPRPSWAAYAPDFKEIGENSAYVEKESEFDVYDEDIPIVTESSKPKAVALVDIETARAPTPLCSSDEEDPNVTGHSIFALTPHINFPKSVPLINSTLVRYKARPERQRPEYLTEGQLRRARRVNGEQIGEYETYDEIEEVEEVEEIESVGSSDVSLSEEVNGHNLINGDGEEDDEDDDEYTDEEVEIEVETEIEESCSDEDEDAESESEALSEHVYPDVLQQEEDDSDIGRVYDSQEEIPGETVNGNGHANLYVPNGINGGHVESPRQRNRSISSSSSVEPAVRLPPRRRRKRRRSRNRHFRRRHHSSSSSLSDISAVSKHRYSSLERHSRRNNANHYHRSRSRSPLMPRNYASSVSIQPRTRSFDSVSSAISSASAKGSSRSVSSDNDNGKQRWTPERKLPKPVEPPPPVKAPTPPPPPVMLPSQILAVSEMEEVSSDESPPRGRGGRSRSSSSSSAINHQWDSD